jgi:hypothetical protein
MTAWQGAELERVGVAVRGLIRLWKSHKPQRCSGGTQEDEIGNTKFVIRKSEMQARMTKKSDPPFAGNATAKGRPPQRKESQNRLSALRVVHPPVRIKVKIVSAR